MTRKRMIAAALLAAGLSLAADGASAESVTYKAELRGTNESPPNDSMATGSAEVTFDTESHAISWNVVYSGLSGPARGAHIHGPAESGSNAGIIVPFESHDSPITGSGVLTPGQAEALEAGLLYVNIHTQTHPGGEIRGNLERAK